MSTVASLVLLGLVSLSHLSPSVPIKSFKQVDVWNYDVIQLIQVQDTLNIIIGADNTLIRLDANLNLIESTSTGPACQPNHLNHCPENVAKNLLNGASVLVAEERKQVLIFCGTAYYGLCSLYLWNSFGEPTFLDTKLETSFLGNHISSIATYHIAKDNINVGMTYDGRPSRYLPDSVSTLLLRPSSDNIYHLHYPHADLSLSIAERYRSTFLVEYVHAFAHDGFQYYLVVQRQTIVSTLYHTVLQRMRLGVLSYFSYVEIPLQCGAESLRYNIATAGYYGVIGPDLAPSLKSGVRAGDAALYVTFSTAGIRYRVGDQRGSLESDSAVCVFTLSDIDEEFMQAQVNCYNGMNSLATRVPWMNIGINSLATRVPWMNYQRKGFNYCTPYRQIANLIPRSVRFPGHQLNPHIRGLQAVESREPLALYTDGVFSSLAITVRKMSEKSLTIGIAGTFDGKLVKFHLNGKTREALAIHQVSGSPATHVRRQMPFDAIEEHVYVLTHDKVLKFPVYSSCANIDCAACVTSRDETFKCSWCHLAGKTGYCSERDECKTASWYENSCPPVVSRFTPNYGPTVGDTPITIYGSGFGNPDRPDDISLNVTVGLKQCRVQNHTFETIRCVTSSNPVTANMSVAVHAVDKTTSLVPYIVDGIATAPTLFKYMSAVVDTISPSYGPRSGGTNLTLFGTHLNIGGVQTVQVGLTNCKVLEKSSQSIVCQTSSVVGGKQEPGPSLVTVTLIIDRSSIESPVNFTYMPDPVITGITPLASFIGGGLNITILGHRMDVIQNPSMVIEFDNKEYVTSCHVQKNGSVMLCPAPGIDADPANGNLTALISFLMDDVTDLRDFAKSHPYLSTMHYVQNPKYFKFETEVFSLVQDLDSNELYLKGIDLNLACTMEDVSVRIGISGVCNVTSLSFTELVCEPPWELSDEEPSREVWVYVGNLQYRIGYLRYVRSSTNLAPGMVIGFFAIFIALIICLLVLYYCYRRRLGPFDRSHQNGMSQPMSEAFTNEHITQRLDYTAAPAPHERRGSNDLELVLPTKYSAIPLLLDGSGLRVHRNQIALFEKIGEGHFGCVWRGILEREPEKSEGGYEVAVKTSRSTMATADVAAFLDEAMIMRDFQHEHVLSLIGICLDRDKGPMVILPFMHHGDLHTYICDPHNRPYVMDLIDFGLQIARGMEYLSEKKFVHRDLAARNCMLDETLQVKVADFGLARDVYDKSYYRPTPGHVIPLPVRWMAVECFEKGVFSTKTDVWAFGVVIWELMTRGIKPYPDVMENWDIFSYLKKGHRLNKPQYCPLELYQIILRCWELEPKDRPSATELVKEIDSFLVSFVKRSASTVNSPLYENVPCPSGSY